MRLRASVIRVYIKSEDSKLASDCSSYLFVIFFQQSGSQMRRGAQLILEEKTADSGEPLDKLQPTCCNLLIFLTALHGQWIVHVPGRRKSSAWPDTAESSSWRWPPCPPQTLPAESGSTYETWKTGWVKVKSEGIIWPWVLEQNLLKLLKSWEPTQDVI